MMNGRIRARITVTLERSVAESIDTICQLENRQRSHLVEALLNFALEHYQPQAPRWEPVETQGKAPAKI